MKVSSYDNEGKNWGWKMKSVSRRNEKQNSRLRDKSVRLEEQQFPLQNGMNWVMAHVNSAVGS